MIVIILSGLFNLKLMTAQAAAILKVDDGQLEIIQGDFVQYFTHGTNPLSFVLDVKDPEAGGRYFWEVILPPSHGQAAVIGQGISGEISYVPAPDYSRKDMFLVEVNDSRGASARVNVVITAALGEPQSYLENYDELQGQKTSYTNSVRPDYLNPRAADAGRSLSQAEMMNHNLSQSPGLNYSGWTPTNSKILSEREAAFRRSQAELENLRQSQKQETGFIQPEPPRRVIPISDEPEYMNWHQTQVVEFDQGDGFEKRQAEFDDLLDTDLGAQHDETEGLFDISGEREGPYFLVYPEYNLVEGYNWTPDTEVTLTIGIYEWTQIFDSEAGLEFYTDPYDISIGDIVTMTDGTTLKTHTVIDLSVTAYDEGAEMVSGTADPGELTIEASDGTNGETLYPVADGSGNWTATFAMVDIAQDTYANIYQYDDDGDCTTIYWRVRDPRISVYHQSDRISGADWTPSTTITITIGTEVWTAESDEGGNFFYFHADSFDILPGQMVTMTDGTYTKTHTVIDLSVTSYDEGTETLNGTGDPGELTIDAYDGTASETLYPTADGSGNWSVTFTTVDIAPSTYALIYQYDDDGDATVIIWIVPDPRISVMPSGNKLGLQETFGGNDGEIVSGWFWMPFTPITLTIESQEWTAESNQWGQVYFDIYPFDILPGHTVTVTDGTYTETHTVANLAITNINEETAQIFGTADPNSEVYIDIVGYPNPLVPVDSEGNWTTDFSWWGDILGMWGDVSQDGEDSHNNTNIIWSLPYMLIDARPEDDSVIGWDWPADTEITLIYDSNTYYEISNSDGVVNFFDLGFDLQVGDTLEMTDGTHTIMHTVLPLEITGYSFVEDTISGTSEPGDEVEVWACYNNNQRCKGIWTFPDISGNWSVDFTGLVDIVKGTSFGTRRWGEGGDNDDFGLTSVTGVVSNLQIQVYPQSEEITGEGWAPNTTITVTIGTEVWTEESEENGMVFLRLYPFDILPGQVVEMTDGVSTKTHTVIDLAVTSYDAESEMLNGTANPGELTIDAWGGTEMETLYPVADGSGNWTAAFTSVDIAPGTGAYIYQYDEDGDYTWTYWIVPDPLIQVFINWNIIAGNGWSQNGTITLTIGTEVWIGETGYTGSVEFDMGAYKILPGQVVEMTDGTYTRSHTVIDLAVTSYDEGTETLSGTANPGELTLFAYSGDDDLHPIADESGNWTATFSLTDIGPGTRGMMFQSDDDGDLSYREWYVPDPHIRVYPLWDEIRGYEWTPDTTVTLTIGTDVWTEESDYDGGVSINTYPFDILSGQLVEMTDGTYTRTHTITNLVVTDVDDVADSVSGTAEAGSEVYVEGWEDWGDYNWEDLSVSADASGNWTAAFTYLDLAPGSDGYARQYDDDGDSTDINWDVPNPYSVVYPQHYELNGWEWEPNTTISLSIDSYTDTADSDGEGYVHFYNLPIDIVAGQVVEMTDGTTTKYNTIRDISVTDVDADQDIVSGTADADSMVNVAACDHSTCEWSHPIADEFGDWSVDFTGLFDIITGSWGYVNQWEDDGDGTEITWNVPSPHLLVHPTLDDIEAWDFEPNTTITLTIGTFTDSQLSNESGWVRFYTEPFDIQPGQLVEMNDGINFEDHLVRDFTIDNIDPDADTVSGTAEPYSELGVYAWYYNEFLGWADPNPIADEFGNWTANFSGVANIRPGVSGGVNQWDEDGDETQVPWYLPNPQIDARPEEDSVAGWGWPGDTEITLTIGTHIFYASSDPYGDVDFWNLGLDLQAGDSLEMTDGTTIKTHIVFPLEVTGYDVDTDTISGTAEPSSLVDVWACWDDNHSCTGINIYADGSGDWSADFTGIVDIVAGRGYGARRWDEDTDATSIYGHVPNPAFDVNPDEDDVWGWDWPAGVEITLTFGLETATTTSDSTGHFNFNDLTFDFQAGDTLEVNDGTTYKSHTILPLTLDSFDEATDTVTGTATPDSQVWSYGCDNDNCDGMWVTADTNGDYFADMSTIGIDIAPGARGNVRQPDVDDDGTCIGWYIPSPHILAHPESDDIEAWNLLPDTPIELTITGGGGYTDTVTSDSTGWVRFDLAPFDLQPGHLIEVFDGESLDSHVVIDFTIDVIDPDTDTISGTAEPGSELGVYAWDGSEFLGWVSPNPVADGSGNWTADFSGTADIKPGVSGGVNQWDEDSDETQVHWYLPNPRIIAWLPDNVIYGLDWLADVEVTLTIGDDHWLEPSDLDGWVFFDMDPFEVQPGQVLEMTDGTNAKIYTVVDLAVTSYDEGAETLSGIADPGELQVVACDDSTCEVQYPTADGSGNWTAAFTSVDIADRSRSYLYQYDEDGNMTNNYWLLPDPIMEVLPGENQVVGEYWPPDIEITLTIGDSRETWMGESDGYGTVIFELEGFEILPDQVVEMTDGAFTQTHVVAALTVDLVDQDLDTVFGTAEPFSDVEACAYLSSGQYYSACFTVSADDQGDWQADFSGSVDISPGAWGSAAQYDEDDDATIVHWEIEADYAIYLPLIVH